MIIIRTILFVSGMVSLLLFSGCRKSPTHSLEIYNPSGIDRIDEGVLYGLNQFANPIPDDMVASLVINDGSYEVPYQLVDEDLDGRLDNLLILTSLKPNESKTLHYEFGSGNSPAPIASRVQAELSVKTGGEFKDKKYIGGKFMNVSSLEVPTEHTDHSSYIRYEGPGWESDKVGYRYYLDWRNAIDIFGKSKPDLALQNVGQDGFDSYHEPSDWGMDILKVGESLGIGSIGIWSNGVVQRVDSSAHTSVDILANGPLEAKILTHYVQWQVDGHPFDLRSILSIRAGSRLTKHDVKVNPIPLNLCTGLVKDPDVEVFTSADPKSEWQYMASWGKQSLANDNLGMAILYSKNAFLAYEEDEYSDIVVLNPKNGDLTYYFLAAWEGEENGIKDIASFQKYLAAEIEKLNKPIQGH